MIEEQISTSKKREVIQRDKKCLNCGSIENLTVDHIVPISKGGTNVLVNLQTLCESCNFRKGNQIQWSWLERIILALHVENLLTNLKNELSGRIIGNLTITRNEITSSRQLLRDELLAKINGQAQIIDFLSKKISALEAHNKIKWVEEVKEFRGYKKI